MYNINFIADNLNVEHSMFGCFDKKKTYLYVENGNNYVSFFPVFVVV